MTIREQLIQDIDIYEKELAELKKRFRRNRMRYRKYINTYKRRLKMLDEIPDFETHIEMYIKEDQYGQ